MTFIVTARIDDRLVVASAKTAREAFAEAVEWKTKNLTGVTISDGAKVYSVQEFAKAMALSEIACTNRQPDAQPE